MVLLKQPPRNPGALRESNPCFRRERACGILAWERVLRKSAGFSHDDPGEDPEPPGPRLTAVVYSAA